MTSRRTFLMASLSAAAVGFVALVTTRLGKKAPQAEAQRSPGDPQPEATQAEDLVLISRSAWGAVEPQISDIGVGEVARYDSVTNPNGWLVYDQPPEEVLNSIVIHHSALPLSDGPREIQKLHLEERGFADIGYQFIIDEKGQLYEGRPLNVRGAHTYRYNYASIGICLMGNFEEIPVPDAQLSTLKKLLANLHTRYPHIDRLAGHKDLNPGQTLCPGANLYPLLPGLAEAIRAQYGI